MKIQTIICLLLLLLSPLFSSQKLKFTTVQNSVIANITYKIIKEAYSRLGIEISLDSYPAKRSLFLANEGEIYDGELHRIKGIEKEYSNLTPVLVPLHHLEGIVLSKKVEFEIKGWESLRPYVIGVRRGIVFTVNGTVGMKRILLNSNEHLLEMLDKGKIDIVVLTRISALKYLQSRSDLKFKILEPAVEYYPMYHYLHKKNLALRPKLTQILKEMEEEGFIKKIRENYIQELLKK